MLPQLLGEFRSGGDPNLRFTPGGTPVAEFSAIASSAKKLDNGEWETTAETGWIRVNCWGALAERVVDDVTKGCKVFLVGRYSQRKYTDRDGNERTSVELRAEAVEVIPPRDDARPRPAASADSWAGAPTQGDEPPF